VSDTVLGSAFYRAALRLFRQGVLPRAGSRLDDLASAATRLSERLLVLVRRKLVLPALAEVRKEEEETKHATARSTRARAAPSAKKLLRRGTTS
jgi:hypothetical protein